MTDTRTYNVSGATLTVTTALYHSTINLTLTLNVAALDVDEPGHSAHQLVNYLRLPHYQSPVSLWWQQRKRTVTCKTGSQAQRIVRMAIATASDAVSAALLDRDRRKAEMAVATTI